MNDPSNSASSMDRLKPQILHIDDRLHPPSPIVQIPMEERFRDVSTQRILDYLEMGVLIPEARAAALAELARRGVPPPSA